MFVSYALAKEHVILDITGLQLLRHFPRSDIDRSLGYSDIPHAHWLVISLVIRRYPWYRQIPGLLWQPTCTLAGNLYVYDPVFGWYLWYQQMPGLPRQPAWIFWMVNLYCLTVPIFIVNKWLMSYQFTFNMNCLNLNTKPVQKEAWISIQSMNRSTLQSQY